MIWIDSSFAIEWLLGTERAKKADFKKESPAILPMQYMETFVFFLKMKLDPIRIANELEALELIQPVKPHLQEASFLYREARLRKSKASMADAILAAVAYERKEKVASFDRDFDSLGLKAKGLFWYP